MKKNLFYSMATALAAACSDSDAPTPATPPAANASPSAVAGQDQTLGAGDVALLDARASNDPDGQIVTFAWSQTAGPTVVLQNADTATASFALPITDEDAALTFTVTVTDDDGAQSVDQTIVNLNADELANATEVAITFDGEPRAYILYTPNTFTPGNPAVVLLHGGAQSMRTIFNPGVTTRRWVELAEENGFAVIAPNGFSTPRNDGLGDAQTWNDIRDDQSGATSLEDDVEFIATVLQDAGARAAFDPLSVFVTGSSNGGIMTMTMLIEEAEAFAGGAAFIAALPEEPVPSPSSATPFMMLNGTDDPLVRFGGGVVGDNGAPTRSVPDTVDYWIFETGADPSTASTRAITNVDPNDNCEIFETTYTQISSQDVRFIFYEAVGGGHNIPDPNPPQRSAALNATIGNQCRDVEGVDLVWDFFNSL